MLDIYYPNGRMSIRLSVFLKEYGVTKFKKLLKIIKMSDKPDEYINKIREYLEANVEVNYSEFESNLIHYEHLVKVSQEEVNRLTRERDRLKEVTKRTMKNGRHASAKLKILREQKTEVMDALKNAREDLRVYKVLYSSTKSRIKELQKQEKDFKRYLEILNEV